MSMMVPMIAIVLFSGGLLYFCWKRKRFGKRVDLTEEVFQVLKNFCQLREGQEILGSAYVTFRGEGADRVCLWVEMTLFFPGSTVTMRESVGDCRPEEVRSLEERIRARVAAEFPSMEIDVGEQRICFR